MISTHDVPDLDIQVGETQIIVPNTQDVVSIFICRRKQNATQW